MRQVRPIRTARRRLAVVALLLAPWAAEAREPDIWPDLSARRVLTAMYDGTFKPDCACMVLRTVPPAGDHLGDEVRRNRTTKAHIGHRFRMDLDREVVVMMTGILADDYIGRGASAPLGFAVFHRITGGWEPRMLAPITGLDGWAGQIPDRARAIKLHPRHPAIVYGDPFSSTGVTAVSKSLIVLRHGSVDRVLTYDVRKEIGRRTPATQQTWRAKITPLPTPERAYHDLLYHASGTKLGRDYNESRCYRHQDGEYVEVDTSAFPNACDVSP